MIGISTVEFNSKPVKIPSNQMQVTRAAQSKTMTEIIVFEQVQVKTAKCATKSDCSVYLVPTERLCTKTVDSGSAV